MPKVIRVLFLCTHNSARSQMAEGLLRWFDDTDFRVFSAGTAATHVRSEAINVMRELEIDISNQTSKTLDRFVEQHFDYVITVCDNVNEVCPIFPNAKERIHWSIDDPSSIEGALADRLSSFRRARDDLQLRIETLFSQTNEP
ncbi:MAG: arsenate reductase ArsC [Anaerolineales bacterium]|nr:MAG: arsenate reductase ArsC [Anaerolineales bacterium]